MQRWSCLLAACALVAGCDNAPTDPGPPGNDTPAASAPGGGDAARVPAGSDPAPAAAGPRAARARLEPTAGHDASGTVRFAPAGGGLEISAELEGLEPGLHGLHLHEFGDCSAPDAASAGGHFTPGRDPHGAPALPPGEHHAGDLGNIVARGDGTARKTLIDAELTFEGEYGVVGRAVVVHRDADDLATQPSGDAGARVACGVIEAVAAAD